MIRCAVVVVAVVGALALTRPAVAQSGFVDLSAPMTGKSKYAFDAEGKPLEIGARSTTEQPGLAATQSGAAASPTCGGSTYGSISCATGQPKTIHVRSYERRDGTVVRGYVRSRR